jgi:hypothetical protein
VVGTNRQGAIVAKHDSGNDALQEGVVEHAAGIVEGLAVGVGEELVPGGREVQRGGGPDGEGRVVDLLAAEGAAVAVIYLPAVV